MNLTRETLLYNRLKTQEEKDKLIEYLAIVDLLREEGFKLQMDQKNNQIVGSTCLFPFLTTVLDPNFLIEFD